jgi:RHS repeat-associated protein
MGAANAAARIGAALTGGQPSQAQASREPALTPLSIGAEFTQGRSDRKSDLVDLNGDGLPELIPDGANANFNFGYRFLGTSRGWADGLMQEENAAVGLSAGLGYGNDIYEYGGGLSASSSRSRQKRVMADINGDGLIDVVRVEGDRVKARLNTGFGFGLEQDIGALGRSLDALGQGESDALGANAYFTFSIPIPLVVWTIYIIINPGATLGASLNRQVIALRDADADGLADLMVTGGLKVGDDLNLRFDNQSAAVYRNPFGTHGLLTDVYLATNPDAAKANYRLSYSRSTPSENDPQSRWVFSELITRHGVDLEDAYGVHDRRTCQAYEQGYFDRFERRFLGFSLVTIVEGCTTSFDQRRLVQLDLRSQTQLAQVGVAAARDSDQLTGIRRLERVYANRSIYESGMLLSESTKDISLPRLVAGAGTPTRTTENTYVLLDVGRSRPERRECFALSVSDAAAPAPSGLPPMRRMLTTGATGEGGLIDFPVLFDHGAVQGPCPAVPAFERDPLRLTPVLVQSLQTSTEGDANTLPLRTAIQFDVDFRARVTRVCDLGNLTLHEDDLCAKYDYDDAVQLSFIHGATGGGTLAFDRRDRVREIVVRSDSSQQGAISDRRQVPDRRRTAAYDPTTGDLIAQCQFERTAAAPDPCTGIQPIPFQAAPLITANGQRVAVRRYHYDEFGNIDQYISPVTADGHFLSRKIVFDDFLALVEVSEQTDYCKIGAPRGQTDPCLPGSGSAPGTDRALGRFRSQIGDIDWRHAVATTQVDVNSNVIRTMLDGTGRPVAVFTSWAGDWAEQADCTKGECSSLSPDPLKAGARLGKLVGYAYRVGDAVGSQPATAVARITRYGDASLYKSTGNSAQATGRITFDTDQHYDQLARLVRTITPAEVCIPGAESPDGAACDQTKRATHAASGIITIDVADRVVDSYLPVPVNGLPALAAATVGPLAGESLDNAPRTHVVSDGFDRPLSVRLTDGNSYAFRYGLTALAPSVVRHRTVVRDARCVPTAMDRDERGLIRAVHEFMNIGTGADFNAHALGSSFDQAAKPIIVGAGWVKDMDYGAPQQQIVACVEGDATASANPGDGTPVVANPLRDPLGEPGARRRRSSTVYDYDALGQLIGVHLPNPASVAPAPPIVPGTKIIRVGYDALGRRIATDDPDRGFEALSYDLVSNLVCHRSGPTAGSDSAFKNMASVFQHERERAADKRIVGEDACLEPESAVRNQIKRVIRHEYLYDRLAKVIYRYPEPIDKDRKRVAITYGRADDPNDVAGNRAGRQVMLADLTGTISTAAYHPIGLPEKVERVMKAVARGAGAAPPADVGKSTTIEGYDAWGLLGETTLQGSFPGLRADGSNDPSAAHSVTIAERITYRYASSEQINEVRIGPCTLATDGTVDCKNVPTIGLVTDAEFDERGNTLRQAFGNGVVTRNEFDPRSNRLVASYSRIGVPCVEYGPEDDCLTSSPPILFQNLSYRYDAGGNVVAYNNAPRYADLCARDASPCPISHRHMGIQGLLVSKSENNLAYDERGRLKTANKDLSIFARNPRAASTSSERSLTASCPDDVHCVMDDRTFEAAEPGEFKISEAFAFSDSHLLTGIRRDVNRRLRAAPLGGAEQTMIRHVYASPHPTAPSASTITSPGPREDQTHHQDDFGRTDLVRCAGCLIRPVPGEGTFDAQKYNWDPDDTLVSARRRIEPPANAAANDRSRYYNQVDQTYDHAGNRAIKRLASVTDRSTGSERKLMRETIYADERLTVMREVGQKPEALLHVFTGSTRLASKWIGGDGIFSYHAQLPTRTVSDVVYARGDDRTTARVYQQLEYAAFGELLVGREKAIDVAYRSPAERHRLARPLYRFDAKELDEETALTYFGARHYNQRLGLWLSPDPILGDYLKGSPNGGVFAPKNTSAYAFGWGNPVSYREARGRFPNSVSQWSEALQNVAQSGVQLIPGSYYGGLASIEFRRGNYGTAAIYEVMGIVDAGLAVFSMGEGPLLSRGGQVGMTRITAVAETELLAVTRIMPVAATAEAELPTLRISASKYPELAENIRNAQLAGHSEILTYGGAAQANRRSALEGLYKIPKILSRDEYPFASTLEGGASSWIGHIPEWQNRAQGGILKHFYESYGLEYGNRFRVLIVE